VARTEAPPGLVVSDLDGTLVSRSGCVSDRTRMVLRAAAAQGAHVTLATGRPMRRMGAVIRGLSVLLVACANGALVYEPATGRIVACQEMSRHAIDAIAAALRRAWPACEIAVERLQRAASGEFEQVLYAQHDATSGWPAGDRARPVPAGMLSARAALKIMVRNRGTQSADMASRAGRLLQGTADVTYANPRNGLIEISHLGASKGWAAKTMAETLDVDVGAAVAFGDMPNDLPMLRCCGHSVAVANAHESVRMAAEITSSCDSDGVAQVLERWFASAADDSYSEGRLS